MNISIISFILQISQITLKYIEGLPSAEAAQRFGYTHGAFRVLCHQIRQFMQTWFDEVQPFGLACSGSLVLDFHTVPTNSDKEPL